MDSPVPLGYTSNPGVVVIGMDADTDQCEVCGDYLQRLQIKVVEHPDGGPDYQPDGPWYEPREHQIGNGRHFWWQQHNCVHPEPDACPFCEQARRLGWDPTDPGSQP